MPKMSKKDFEAEHKRLIKVLDKGSKKDREKESRKQKQEVRKEKGK